MTSGSRTNCDSCKRTCTDFEKSRGWIFFSVVECALVVGSNKKIIRDFPSRTSGDPDDSLDFCSKDCLMKYLKL
jgi:hypothetical protein